MLYRAAVLALTLGLATAGCRDLPARPDDARGLDAALDDAAAALDAPRDSGEDGAPIRLACTTPAGTALSDGTFGRLDGILVAVAPPGSADRACRPDSDHVHLQVRVDGSIYDIAVNVGSDVHSQAFDLVGPGWAEGWHTGVTVDYPGVGIHADTIPLPAPGQLAQTLAGELAAANHISIFATGYGPTGAHLVHRNGAGHDGLVVTHPLAAAGHARAFSFTNQTF